MDSRKKVANYPSVKTRLSLLCLLMPFLFACGSGSDDIMLGASGDTLGGNENSSTQLLGGSGSDAGAADEETDTAIEGTPLSLSDTSLGLIVAAGESKRTTYTFRNDTAGQSTCAGSCAVIWPAVLANSQQRANLAALKAAAGPLSLVSGLDIIDRSDFSLQWTLYGKPLYHYAGDGAEGETNGENLDGSWFVARPLPVEAFTVAGFEGTLMKGRGSVSAGVDDPALRRASLDGLALYIYTPDTGNTSTCNAGCAEDWPPLYADRGAVATGGFTIVTRQNGSAQWAYNNQPLYFYIGDDAPGVVNGDGADTVWFVARP